MEDREKLKQELLEELKTEYIMTPIKEKALIVNDITKKYERQLKNKFCVVMKENRRDSMSAILSAIRKVVALHLGFYTIRDIEDLKDRQAYRTELERFTKEYILGEASNAN